MDACLHGTHVLAGAPNGGFHPIRKAGEAVRHAVEWLDEYTSPRPETHGNLGKPSIFQAAFSGASDGFYIFGPMGIVTGGAAAAAGIVTQRGTHHQYMGVAVGTVAGAILGGATASVFGGPVGVTLGVVNGALLGAFETLRGHSEADTRDCGNGSMISAFFLHGPAKMAGGLAGMIGANFDSKWAKAAIGGALGVAFGAALAAVGVTPVGIATAAIASGAAGAIGPFFGPRFSQFFRNLADDAGRGLSKLAEKAGMVDKPLGDKARLTAGQIPASVSKEALRAFLYSDGSITALIAGSVKECIRQVHIVWQSRQDGTLPGVTNPHGQPTPAATQPGAATKPAQTPAGGPSVAA